MVSAMNPLRTFNPVTTWACLTPAKQAEIGSLVLEWVFADFVSGSGHAEDDKLCSEEIRSEAIRNCDRLLPELLTLVPATLPEMFGPDGEDPPWAWREAG